MQALTNKALGQALVEYTVTAVLIGGMVAVSFQAIDWKSVLSQYAASGSGAVVAGGQLQQAPMGVATP
jgi:hypothetical protein